jgi:hypothetical protein
MSTPASNSHESGEESAAPPSLLPDSVGASVDTDNPWLGLASFTEDSRAFFFGREQEITELERRVQRKLLTVLFGKSGLGKTSILQAGLVPGLRARGYFPVYLRIDYGHDSPEPAEQIKQAINKAAAGQGAGHATAHAAPIIDPTESIWEFLHHREEVQTGGGEPLRDVSAETPITPIPLLIFDQFEELFTLAQSDEFGRARAARFVEELADLVENRAPKALEAKLDTDETLAERFDFARSDYRVVIALREDYLAPLESLKKQMPSLSQNRLRLAPMTGSQALEAVLLPGNRLRPGKPLVSEEVAEAIVRFVAGGSELANAEVEPSLLSLICRELNEQRLAQGRGEISQDLLAGSHETILSSFYERALADQPAGVRRIIEDELLTESGYRENLAEESLLKRFQAAGTTPDALIKLVNRRLLRIEERLDVRRVELTHDVLTGVVKASRDQRHEREAREATQRMLAEQAARESAARRALRRARAIAAGCTALAVVAVIAAILAVVSVQRARHAEQLARQTREISEQARQQAEGLLGFLTDDFVRELETFGRYQTIAELSQREIDYFQHLPPQLQDPQTVRSGGLALVNHAAAVNSLGDAATAARNISEAVTLLEGVRHDGDRSDATAVVLARAYTWSGWVSGLQTYGIGTDGTRAAQLLRPIVAKADASLEARRAYGEALSFLAFWGQTGTQPEQNEAGVKAGRESLRVLQQLRERGKNDLSLGADYAQAGGWLTSALVNLDRTEEARRVGEDALAVADQVVAQRPQYGWALIGKQTLEATLAATAREDLDPASALHYAGQGVQTSLALVAVEPRNVIYVGNLGFYYGEAGADSWAAGRLPEAIAYDRKGMETTAQAEAGGANTFAVANVADFVAVTAYRQAQLGDFAAAAATAAAGDALTPDRLRGLNSADHTAAFVGALRRFTAAALAYEREDFGAARRIARAALAQLPVTSAGGGAESGMMNDARCRLAEVEGRADYESGDFAAAARAQGTALQACQDAAIYVPLDPRRTEAGIAIWLSMALAHAGNRQEAAQTIGPVVTMYRALANKNHGDEWLPLELAEALYAQSLTDHSHRPALLREAAALIAHLTPTIATLHDTRAWRVRIEKAHSLGGSGAHTAGT